MSNTHKNTWFTEKYNLKDISLLADPGARLVCRMTDKWSEMCAQTSGQHTCDTSAFPPVSATCRPWWAGFQRWGSGSPQTRCCLQNPPPQTWKTARYQMTSNNLVERTEDYSWQTRSIPCLQMPWLLVTPSHQQQWYWRCRVNGSTCPMLMARGKITQTYFFVSSNHFSILVFIQVLTTWNQPSLQKLG